MQFVTQRKFVMQFLLVGCNAFAVHTVQDTTKTEVSLDIFSSEDTPHLWTLQVTAEVMVQTGARFRVVAKLKEMIAKAVAHWGLPELNHELSPFREIAESLTLLFVKEVLV